MSELNEDARIEFIREQISERRYPDALLARTPKVLDAQLDEIEEPERFDGLE